MPEQMLSGGINDHRSGGISFFFKSKIIPERAFGEGGGRQQRVLPWGRGRGVDVRVWALNSRYVHHHEDKWAESAP